MTSYMTKNTLLLFALAASLLTIGAGCAKQDVNKETGSAYNTSSAVSANNTTDDKDKDKDKEKDKDKDESDDLAVFIEPGVEIIKIKIGTSTVATQNYINAIAIYGKNDLRFQFTNCSVIPKSLNINRDVKFMIDNRDGESHQIGIGAKTFQLAAYDFAIINVKKSGSYKITCDGGGAAHVGVEN